MLAVGVKSTPTFWLQAFSFEASQVWRSPAEHTNLERWAYACCDLLIESTPRHRTWAHASCDLRGRD
eukprot:11699308-Karenia_brevis.AAC.1